MGGAYGTYRGQERHIQGLVGKPEGKRPLGRPKHRWVGCGGMVWIELAQVGTGGRHL